MARDEQPVEILLPPGAADNRIERDSLIAGMIFALAV
jgi:hypothetical protein